MLAKGKHVRFVHCLLYYELVADTEPTSGTWVAFSSGSTSIKPPSEKESDAFERHRQLYAPTALVQQLQKAVKALQASVDILTSDAVEGNSK